MVPMTGTHGFYGTLLRHNDCLVIWAQHTESIVSFIEGFIMEKYTMCTFHAARLQ